MITFEYPLNEKSRSYLRFEHLFLQIKNSKEFCYESDATAFFKALFELLELSERCDIRHDLIKDLRLLSESMNNWLMLDGVDHDAVSQLIIEIDQLIEAVQKMAKQFRYFKTNRFLTSLKQRFSIPSGCCNFDLPQFHFWLAKDKQHFICLEKALTLFLKIKRSQAVETEQVVSNSFYQGEVEHCDFIMIKVTLEQAVYPMISGHKNRYSIRFMNADYETNPAKNILFKQLCY